jgi:hypothetical protein
VARTLSKSWSKGSFSNSQRRCCYQRNDRIALAEPSSVQLFLELNLAREVIIIQPFMYKSIQFPKVSQRTFTKKRLI